MGLNDFIANRLIHYLTEELPGYQRRVPNDMTRMRETMEPCDILLVEGNSRISQMIMYLTQSSWSHAAFYIGDALMRWGGPHAEEALARYGEEATNLLVESDMIQGVTVVPLSKYQARNLRICRPHSLLQEDRDRVLAVVLGHLGVRYDRRNIFDLARYLTPVHLLPRKFRRRPFYFGSSGSREVICSALIAKAFYKVSYPIQPLVMSAPAANPGPGGSFASRIMARHPSYIMPRDFDLSPNFEVLKIHLPGQGRFDYRELIWG